MDDATRAENEQFENDVRRIARELWPTAEYDGAAIVDRRETDGVFDAEDCRHVVEATTSRKRVKAEEDIRKLLDLIAKLRPKSGTRAIRGWFITRDEPTADQRRVAERHRDVINTLSFAQFQSKLVDSHTYLRCRNEYAFGSVRDPGTGDRHATVDYVSLDVTNTKTGSTVSCSQLSRSLAEGNVVILLGDYGAGKSMTLREVYHDLRKIHLRGKSSTFPVYLNLRDHYGQDDPAEILHRHAKSVGFGTPHHLVRAWRAGYVHLLLDGFDEITALYIQGPWRKLKNNRYRATAGIRRLIQEHPRLLGSASTRSCSRAGLLAAGRAHFFDNSSERRRALGLPTDAWEVSLNEFTDDQIAEYFEKVGLTGFVPQWLPSKPLLVGYLAATRLLADLGRENEVDAPHPAAGWDMLLDRVAHRESQIEAGIDGPTVRKILERLATMARASGGGLGPLSQESVVQTFQDICGYPPDDRGMVLLQRLPGLGAYREEENSRIFIDENFVDACRAGDLATYVEHPFDLDSMVLARIESGIGDLGISLAQLTAERGQLSAGKLHTAIEQAKRNSCHYMILDLVRIALSAEIDIQGRITLEGLVIPELELGGRDADLSGVRFVDCLFSRVELDSSRDATKWPNFSACMIDALEGRVSRHDLPTEKFDAECVIESYVESADTTASVLALDLSLGTRVCLTILKKIYERSGSGRRENALYRGMDHRAQRLVPNVLQVLQSERLIIPYRKKGDRIWLASRERRRAARIIAAPAGSTDSVIRRCENISE